MLQNFPILGNFALSLIVELGESKPEFDNVRREGKNDSGPPVLILAFWVGNSGLGLVA